MENFFQMKAFIANSFFFGWVLCSILVSVIGNMLEQRKDFR